MPQHDTLNQGSNMALTLAKILYLTKVNFFKTTKEMFFNFANLGIPTYYDKDII